jgi:hypothetical protein
VLRLRANALVIEGAVFRLCETQLGWERRQYVLQLHALDVNVPEDQQRLLQPQELELRTLELLERPLGLLLLFRVLMKMTVGSDGG